MLKYNNFIQPKEAAAETYPQTQSKEQLGGLSVSLL